MTGRVNVAVDLPAVPGKPKTIANWTSLWLTDQAAWPVDGEIDAVEAEPATGVNAVAYHWGTARSPQSVSTDGFAPDGNLPVPGPNLTPGWHVVDVVYAKGYFAVYYDGKLFSTGQDSSITGAPLNLIISSSVTPNTKAVDQTIGGTAPVNSDSSPRPSRSSTSRSGPTRKAAPSARGRAVIQLTRSSGTWRLGVCTQ